MAWTIHCNIPIARRRTLCFVEDHDGELRWSGKSVGAAFRFLHEAGIDSVELSGAEPGQQFFVQFRPI